jgi:hypothetical protein
MSFWKGTFVNLFSSSSSSSPQSTPSVRRGVFAPVKAEKPKKAEKPVQTNASETSKVNQVKDEFLM